MKTKEARIQYQDFISKLTPEKAIAKAAKFRSKVARKMAAATRSAHRHEDCGPLDIAHEICEPWDIQAQVLDHFVIHGNQLPPPDLLSELVNVMENAKKSIEHKAAQPVAQNLVGKIVHFTNKGNKLTGQVVSQHRSKFGTIRYKLHNGWRISENSVTKIVTPRDKDEKSLAKNPDKMKEFLQGLVGKTITFNSRKRGVVSGTVSKATKSKVMVQGLVGMWRVPARLISSVEGKKVSME